MPRGAVVKRIESLQNSLVKNFVKLRDDRKERESQRVFVVEGLREVERALLNRFVPSTIFIHEDKVDEVQSSMASVKDAVIVVSKIVFQKISVRDEASSVVAIFEYPKESIDLDAIFLRERLRIICVEGNEKPGNLGAIVRTAAGLGYDAVGIIGKGVDPWNPNAIRASLGAVFEVPVFELTLPDFFNLCRKHKVMTLGAVVDDSALSIRSIQPQKKMAIVLGSEADGMSPECIQQLDQTSFIEMHSKTIDSFNLSVAAAIYMTQFQGK